MDCTDLYDVVVDLAADFRHFNLYCNEPNNDGRCAIRHGNGNWLPFQEEPRDELYWWAFPWVTKLQSRVEWPGHKCVPYAIWKLISGSTVTHLPELLMKYLAPNIFWESYGSYLDPAEVRVYNFGSSYEVVLEYYTQFMLGVDDEIPETKRGLLLHLFDITGFFTN